jgi:hypothetical protein
VGGAHVVPRHELFGALAAAQRGLLRDVAPRAQGVTCGGCGAVTVTDHHVARCPFCGGDVVTAPDGPGIAPDAVAPFAVEERDAAALVNRWLRRRWFAPGDLHRAAAPGRLQRVYLPFWAFSVHSVRQDKPGRRGRR